MGMESTPLENFAEALYFRCLAVNSLTASSSRDPAPPESASLEFIQPILSQWRSLAFSKVGKKKIKLVN